MQATHRTACVWATGSNTAYNTTSLAPVQNSTAIFWLHSTQLIHTNKVCKQLRITEHVLLRASFGLVLATYVPFIPIEAYLYFSRIPSPSVQSVLSFSPARVLKTG